MKFSLPADSNTMPDSEQTVNTEDSKACFHCGLPVPPSENAHRVEGHSFCCGGCRSAWQFINSSGLGNYYRFRDELPMRAVSSESDAEDAAWQAVEQSIAVKDGRRKSVFFLEGIHCASCVWLNEQVLGGHEGITACTIRLSSGHISLEWDERTSLDEISRLTAAVGYRLVPVDSAQADIPSNRRELKQLTVAGFFAGNIMLLSVALYAGYFSFMESGVQTLFKWLSLMMALPVYLYSARGILKNGLRSMVAGHAGMDVLLGLGISLAFFYSILALFTGGEVYFDSVCFVTFVILSGRYVEKRIRWKSAQTINNLLTALPASVRRVRSDGHTEEVMREAVTPGETIEIWPGESVPLDGLLLDRPAELGLASLTGEFQPVNVKPQSTVQAGTRVVSESIRLEVLTEAGQSSLDQIRQSAMQSIEGRTSRQYMADVGARWFIRFVLVLASAAFFWHYFWQGSPLGDALIPLISLLIVACPCALSLAVPAAHAAAISNLFRRNILIRDGAGLEKWPAMKHIFFDKTGTLTNGRFTLSRVEALAPFSDEQVLLQAGQMQARLKNTHPLAHALWQAARAAAEKPESSQLPAQPGSPQASQPAGRLRYYSGQGVVSRGSKGLFVAGSAAFLQRLGFDTSALPQAEAGQVEVWLGQRIPGQRRLCGRLLLEDRLRESSFQAVAYLSRRFKAALLSGDRRLNVERTAGQLKLADSYAGCTPQQKQKILKKHDGVIMIGDGVNDAVALGSADISISLKSGSGISMAASDIVLINNNLSDLVFIDRLARKTRSILVLNLVFATGYNLFFLPMALAGAIHPLFCALAMSSSSIIVLLNSLRLLKFNIGESTYTK